MIRTVVKGVGIYTSKMNIFNSVDKITILMKLSQIKILKSMTNKQNACK